MIKAVVGIDGMACNMCEAHICETIRRTFPEARKVSASFRRKEAEFLTELAPDEEALKKAIEATGYTYLSLKTEPYEKKGLFRFH